MKKSKTKKSVIAYRLQHKVHGTGPYTHVLHSSRLMVKLPNHSEPQDFEEFCEWSEGKYESNTSLADNWIFGWTTIDLARKFTRKIKLGNFPYHWTKYIANDYIILPDGQICFDRNTVSGYEILRSIYRS